MGSEKAKKSHLTSTTYYLLNAQEGLSSTKKLEESSSNLRPSQEKAYNGL